MTPERIFACFFVVFLFAVVALMFWSASHPFPFGRRRHMLSVKITLTVGDMTKAYEVWFPRDIRVEELDRILARIGAPKGIDE